ncbi:MAG: entericidin A/B family lipoprotein [Proteobacteria bacterium]|nr:entericidin A/B family lipoprotein [Pseudomonadota bacterium]
MRKAIALFLLIAMSQLLVACNTVHGFGQDIEKVGEKMQEKSKR